MKYKAALKKYKEGYSMSYPGLPCCWSQGKTEDEASKISKVRFANTFDEYTMGGIRRRGAAAHCPSRQLGHANAASRMTFTPGRGEGSIGIVPKIELCAPRLWNAAGTGSKRSGVKAEHDQR